VARKTHRTNRVVRTIIAVFPVPFLAFMLAYIKGVFPTMSCTFTGACFSSTSILRYAILAKVRRYMHRCLRLGALHVDCIKRSDSLGQPVGRRCQNPERAVLAESVFKRVRRDVAHHSCGSLHQIKIRRCGMERQVLVMCERSDEGVVGFFAVCVMDSPKETPRSESSTVPLPPTHPSS
jgi:hypothetical protein